VLFRSQASIALRAHLGCLGVVVVGAFERSPRAAMGERAALTRLRREFQNIQSEKIPHIVARPTEKNMLVWHYVLHDLPVETPYIGGVYWGKLVFPKEYPLKPPAIYMLTPSGRFETNSRLCLSMSDFHPESWNPSWRIESILIGLVSFMLDATEPRTTGGVHTTAARRREYAKASFEFNRNSAEFRELFPEFCDEVKRHPSGVFFLDGPSPAALRTLGEATVKKQHECPQCKTRWELPEPTGSQCEQCSCSVVLVDAEAADRAPRRLDPREEDRPVGRPRGGGERGGGLPTALLALSVLVLLVSCLGLYLSRSDRGGGSPVPGSK